MDDEKDFAIKEQGFKLVDRVVEACAAEGLYTVLDMHTFPGGQNAGWHSDSGVHRSLFWENKVLQDRSIEMWVEIAMRYVGNEWVCRHQMNLLHTIRYSDTHGRSPATTQ